MSDRKRERERGGRERERERERKRRSERERERENLFSVVLFKIISIIKTLITTYKMAQTIRH